MHTVIVSSLLLLWTTSTQVAAHGMMNFPIPRALPGDQQNGFTYARSASNRNFDMHPDPDINCAYLPKGPVFTQVLAPGPATVDYTITAWHMGGCKVYISKDGQKTWQEIGSDPTCGVQSANPTGRGSINVVIPDGTYNAVLRWYYLADNGGAPNEFFNNCADIQVSATGGTNVHDKVEFLGGGGSGFVPLAKSPSQYYDASCPVAGQTLCSGNKNFINQCISLAAGNGWAGGSSWLAYQCPPGATCQSVNGVDACTGGAASGSNPLPQPPPVIVPTAVVPTYLPPAPTVVAGNGGGAPCAQSGELRLPIPEGQNCESVKKACQSQCTSNQLYNIEYNRCYSESESTAVQWCQCNGVTWYGAAFGKATKACPSSPSEPDVPAEPQVPAPGPTTTAAGISYPPPPAPEPTQPVVTDKPPAPAPPQAGTTVAPVYTQQPPAPVPPPQQPATTAVAPVYTQNPPPAPLPPVTTATAAPVYTQAPPAPLPPVTTATAAPVYTQAPPAPLPPVTTATAAPVYTQAPPAPQPVPPKATTTAAATTTAVSPIASKTTSCTTTTTITTTTTTKPAYVPEAPATVTKTTAPPAAATVTRAPGTATKKKCPPKAQ
ncbi:hypothetical protein BDR26DRAFT_1008650 [Obelidium mucronatum]|nr:hypothetical protein BDR26DRAFT_1008650 [Obelidium mucronatum]